MKEFCELIEGDDIVLFLKACPGVPFNGKVSKFGNNCDWVSFDNEGYECFVDAEDVFMIGVKKT